MSNKYRLISAANWSDPYNGTGGSAVLDGNFTQAELPFAWWLERAKRTLAAQCDLPENWDSYGARAPLPYCAEVMGECLAAIAHTFPQSEFPTIEPTVNGGFAATWLSGQVEFILEAEPGQQLTVSVCSGGEEDCRDFDLQDMEPMLELGQSFFPG